MPERSGIKPRQPNLSKKMTNKRSRILLIGIGNEYRNDDAVGLVVARHLNEQPLDHVEVIEETGEGAALMETWKDAGTVILIDAIFSGAEPGTIFRFDVHAQPIPKSFFHCSTHAFGVAEAIELARILEQLPPRLIIFGIEGKDFAAGKSLSAEVVKAARKVVEHIIQEVRLNTEMLKTKG